MTANEEKPKSRLSKIYTVIKWCVKWAATAGGLFCIIYIFNDLQAIAIIYVLGILFIFSLIFAPRSEQIRVIRFFPKIFIPCDCDQYSDRGAYIWKTVQKIGRAHV